LKLLNSAQVVRASRDKIFASVRKTMLKLRLQTQLLRPARLPIRDVRA
jgi:hypothetical protein